MRPHPHIGLATVTYLFEGGQVHRDSLGNVQAIVPGDVNWMTAGRGIVHSERTGPEDRAAGHRLHGLQTWVALPKSHEQVEPSFSHHPKASLPEIEQPGVTMRLLAGTAFGRRAPTPTFSPMIYLAIDMEAGAAVDLPPEHEERGVYVVDGDVEVGGERGAGRTHGGAGARTDCAHRSEVGVAAGRARRREDGRRAADLVELRRQLQGADRQRERALARAGLIRRCPAKRNSFRCPDAVKRRAPRARGIDAAWQPDARAAARAPCAETSIATSPPPREARRRDRCFPR